MIYWDHNASTPLRAEVAEALTGALSGAVSSPGNASSVHRGGREWRGRLESARTRAAKALGCEPRELCFTASGSEADALALRGAFASRRDKSRRRIVTSRIEHPSLLLSAGQLEAGGAIVTRVPPRHDGQVPLDALLSELTQDVAVCSLMWANNETGVLQPVRQAAQACRQRGILFHTDAVQAAGKVPISFRDVEADLLSLSGHKLYAPPGIGALLVRRGVEVEALTPGHQEWGRRGGTQNVLFAEALATALELACAHLDRETARLAALRDGFEREILSRIQDVRVNGGGALRVPNTSNLEFVGADGEALLIALDLEGICASSGAACASGSLSPSHVLTAMGLTTTQAQASLRFSLGLDSTSSEVDRVLEALCKHVPRAQDAALSG